MSRSLNAADLGKIGETNFELLCDKAGLVCNKSSRDVNGWDFLVEFPMAAPSLDVTLDQRTTTACRVQLKSTVAGGNDRVSLRLSAAERLAKDAGPALVVVFLLRPNGDGICGYLVHLLGEELAQILKRLRSAEASQTFAINHKSITLDYRKQGTRFEFTAEGLRKAIADACGPDPARYALEKQRQLKELGYEDGRFEVEALVWVEGPEHLSNVLLGLVPLKPKRVKVFDARFGIRIPYQGPLFQNVEEFTINPPHVGECQVAIHGGVLAPVSIFSADVFIAPPISALVGPQLSLRHPDFLITLSPAQMEFVTAGNFYTVPRSLERWINLVRALVNLGTGQGRITISGLPKSGPFALPSGPLDGPDQEQLPQLQQFLEGWHQLTNRAGVASSAEFTIEAIWATPSAQQAAAMWMTPGKTYMEFENLGDYGVTDDTIEALYFNSAELADAAISFAVKITVQRREASEWRYRSTALEFLDIRPAVSDLRAYAKRQAEAHNLHILIDPANLSLANSAEEHAVRSNAS